MFVIGPSGMPTVSAEAEEPPPLLLLLLLLLLLQPASPAIARLHANTEAMVRFTCMVPHFRKGLT